MVLFIILVFFLGLTLDSTWAADHVVRSGRGPIARWICYLELYPPVVALIVWSLIVVTTTIVMTSEKVVGLPTWGQRLTPVALGGVLVGLAHAGVIRRWHPAIRAVVYAAWIVMTTVWLWWAFG